MWHQTTVHVLMDIPRIIVLHTIVLVLIVLMNRLVTAMVLVNLQTIVLVLKDTLGKNVNINTVIISQVTTIPHVVHMENVLTWTGAYVMMDTMVMIAPFTSVSQLHSMTVMFVLEMEYVFHLTIVPVIWGTMAITVQIIIVTERITKVIACAMEEVNALPWIHVHVAIYFMECGVKIMIALEFPLST